MIVLSRNSCSLLRTLHLCFGALSFGWIFIYVKSTAEHLYSLLEAIHRNEAFARKEEQKEIGQLEHNKPRRLHHL